MDVKTRNALGHLIEVGGDSFVAILYSEHDGMSMEKMVGLDKVRVGQVGSYMMVKQSGNELLCTVESMWLDTDSSGNDQMKIRLVPLGEFNTERRFERGITHYPTTNAELHLVSTWNLERIFSDFSEVYYKVGKLSAFNSIDVFLDASNFFGRHAAILGQTGSGKS